MKAAILRRPWPEHLDACIHAFATRKRLAGAPCGAHSSVLDGHRRSSALKPTTRGKDHISGLARFLQSAKANQAGTARMTSNLHTTTDTQAVISSANAAQSEAADDHRSAAGKRACSIGKQLA